MLPTVTPNKVQFLKSRYNNGKLFINSLYEYELTPEINKQASNILNRWLRRARLVLRVAGGDKECLLMSAESVRKYKASHPHRKSVSHYIPDNVLVPDDKLSQHKVECEVRDIIMKGKVDIPSISYVLRSVKYGSQDWKNIANRVRSEFKPIAMFHLIQGVKLEDS